jgi:hypothetical protein
VRDGQTIDDDDDDEGAAAAAGGSAAAAAAETEGAGGAAARVPVAMRRRCVAAWEEVGVAIGARRAWSDGAGDEEVAAALLTTTAIRLVVAPPAAADDTAAERAPCIVTERAFGVVIPSGIGARAERGLKGQGRRVRGAEDWGAAIRRERRRRALRLSSIKRFQQRDS